MRAKSTGNAPTTARRCTFVTLVVAASVFVASGCGGPDEAPAPGHTPPAGPVKVDSIALTYPRSGKSGGGLVRHVLERAQVDGAQALGTGRHADAIDDGAAALQVGSRARVHRIEGRAGELFELTMRSDTLDSFLVVLRDDEAEGLVPLAFDDDGGDGSGAARVRFEVPNDGVYLVLAGTATSPRTGPYELELASEGIAAIARGTDASGRYALLIGAGDYAAGTENDLPAVANDLALMRATLEDKLGFRPEDVLVLADGRATRHNLIRGFREHLAAAGPDGVAFFYYSGHGVQLAGNLGQQDVESDGIDEALFLADASFVLDDELALLRGELLTDDVLVVVDACHSGTITMAAAGVRTKEVDPSEIGVLLQPVRAPLVAANDTTVERATLGDSPHVLIGSSRDVEVSLCASAGDTLGGDVLTAESSVFTHCFVLALELEGTDVPLNRVLATTYDAMYGWLHRVGTDQQPQVLGARASESLASILRLP